MSTHLVTGYAGTEHIQSADQGSFNAAFFGTGQFVMEIGNECEASIIDNNTVRVLDGDILMKGRHIRINPNTYEDVTIETGTAGVNRYDLIVMEYSKNTSTGIEDAYLKVVRGSETEGTPSDPGYTNGDILSGAVLNQMPLYRVKIEGVVLSEIEAMFTTIPTYKTLAEKYEAQFKTACQSHLDSLGILETMEEIQANTQENQLAGALALKEGYNALNTNLNEKTTWKHLGYVTGTEEVTLPDEFEELYITVNDNRVKNDTVWADLFTIVIPNVILSNIPKQFVLSSSSGTGSTDFTVQVRVSKTIAKLETCRSGTSNYSSTATFDICYR